MAAGSPRQFVMKSSTLSAAGLKTGIAISRLIRWLGLNTFKFHDWRVRKGTENEHNSQAPRAHWIADWEREAIIEAHHSHRQAGYRRLAYILLDAGEVCVSPSTVYRVLSEAGQLRHWERKPSSKGTGFIQPLQPHAHWHVDISYFNISGTFYYLCSVLDGCSRAILAWDIQIRTSPYYPQSNGKIEW